MKMNGIARSAASLLGLGIALMTASQAQAQQAQGGSDRASTNAAQTDATTGDIIVTAQRRSELASRTPVPITAISGDILLERSIRNTQDLNNLAPGLQVNAGNNATLVTLRGVGILLSNDILSPSVMFNLDGVALGRPRTATAQFYDLARIEVLRGPQGTLYGRNAVAGSINLITNRPSFDRVQGNVSVGAGNLDSFEGTFALNLPVSDTLAFRAAGQATTRDNYTQVRNTPANGLASLDYGVQHHVSSFAGRVSMLFKPTDRLTWFVSGDISRNNGYDPPVAILDHSLTNNATSLDAPNPFAGKKHRSDLTTILGGYQYLNNYGANSELSYDFDFATLTYQFGYRGFKEFANQFTGYLSAANASASQIGTTTTHRGTEFTHELRLNSAPDSPVKWVLGGYFFDENQYYFFAFRPLLPPLNAFTPVANHPDSDVKSYAAFGQVTVPVTHWLNLTGGLRYTNDKLDAVNITTFGVRTTEKFRSDKVNYRVAIDVTPADGHLLYASISTGYKAGGSNYGNGVNFQPENVTNYELGYKGRFFNNHLLLNATAFYFEYKDVQQSVLTTPPGGSVPLVLVQNAALARNKGLELESVVRPTDNDRIEATLSLQDAHFASFPNCILTGGAAFNCTGTELPLSPDAVFRVAYEHSFRFGNGSKLALRAGAMWSSSYNLSLGDKAFTRQPAYHTIDLSARWDSPGDRWFLQAYAKNLEDVSIITNFGGTYWPAFNLDPGRQFGVRAGFKF